MHRTLSNTAGAMIAAALFAAQSATAHDGKLTFAPVLAEAAPAVVSIQVVGQRRSRWGGPESSGSGVIIDAAKGHVVTNHHVIQGARNITVTLKDRREFEGEVIGSDPGTDIALLKIDADDLQALPLGDSDELAVGDLVVAIGSPFGFVQSATSGIVSALGRSGFTREGYEDFIQTDAAINRGNSGGALVDLDGRLVGINSLIVSPSGVSAGLGFAVPSNIVKSVTEQILEFGQVRRGQLGVQIGDVAPQFVKQLGLDSAKGAVVGEVVAGSAADVAGIQPGDVIVSFDNEEVVNTRDLRDRVGLASIGDEVELVVMRNGKAKTVEATISGAEEATVPLSASSSSLPGATLRDLSPDHRLYRRVRGVEVVEVEPGSRAWQLDLRGGDIILAVNQRPVGNVREFEARVGDGPPFSLLVQRGNRQRFFFVP